MTLRLGQFLLTIVIAFAFSACGGGGGSGGDSTPPVIRSSDAGLGGCRSWRRKEGDQGHQPKNFGYFFGHEGYLQWFFMAKVFAASV